MTAGALISESDWLRLRAAWARERTVQTMEKKKYDPINHPKHYCREGGMECLEEMELVFGANAVRTFCLLNAWKYRYRAADKNGAQDLAKSDWYMQKYRELSPRKEPYD